MDVNAVLAVATVALVMVTAWYVRLTARLAKSAEESLRLQRTPNVIAHIASQGQLYVTNLSPHLIRISHLVTDVDDRDATVQPGVVGAVVKPGCMLYVTQGKELKSLVNGGLRISFAYSPTGHELHRLELTLAHESPQLAMIERQTLVVWSPPPPWPLRFWKSILNRCVAMGRRIKRRFRPEKPAEKPKLK